MSLHFEFVLAMDLKPETPQNILDTLAYMTRNEESEFEGNLPLDFYYHVEDEWKYILQNDQATIPGDFGGSFHRAFRYNQNGQDIYRYTLSFRIFLLDDYFYDVYESFLKWLAKYSDTIGFVDYWHEEADLHPVLIYFKNGKVYFSKINQTPSEIISGEAW